MKRTNVLTAIGAATLLVAGSSSASVLFHEDFESPVDGWVYSDDPAKPGINDGWTGNNRATYLRGPDTTGWTGTTGDQAAVIAFRNSVATSPGIATPEAYDNISVMVDVRPGGNSVGAMNAGGEIRFYGTDDKTITRVLFYNDGIRVYDFSSKSTGILWSYEGADTLGEVQVDIDNVNQTFTLTYDQGNGESSYSGSWLSSNVYGGSEGPFSYVSFKATDGNGTSAPWATNSFAMDNLYITDGTPVPEPASMALLAMGGLWGLTRPRRR